MLQLRADCDGELSRQRDRDAEHVLGNRARPNAARARDHDLAGEQFRKHQAADADRRALHPAQPPERREDVAIDERREGDVGVGKKTTQRLPIPAVEKRVLRKVAPKLIDVAPRHDPGRRRADDADDDDHGTMIMARQEGRKAEGRNSRVEGGKDGRQTRIIVAPCLLASPFCLAAFPSCLPTFLL